MEQRDWDKNILNKPDYTFLQSFAWGEFQAALGEKVFRWPGCQVFTVTARRGKFLFAPHISKIGKTLVDSLVKIAKENGCSFIRISPWVENTAENKNIYADLGFRDAPTYMHTEDTWLVPITGLESEILANMRKTTRNLINRGLREKIEITQSDNVSDVKYLYDLQIETVARHHFVPFSLKYLQTEFSVLQSRQMARLFLGRFNNQITSAAIIIFFGKRAFYFQSGSKETKEPVSYVLQWEVIKEAKRRGCEIYNMWGVAPQDQPRHKFAGITIFKSGFGGYRKSYLHAQDLPLSARYWLTYLLEKLPRGLRRI